METESLVALAAGGNLKEVEDQWIARLEADSTTPDTVVRMLPVIDVLVERGNASQATALAWTTLELLGERFSASQVLPAAGPLLLKLRDCAELRQQVTDLYRQAYAQREGIEALIEEAGIAGGRPVRRALRTLDVCLAVTPDTFVAARHEDATAKVRSVDPQTWLVRIVNAKGEETQYGPVEFADNYVPVGRDDYRVLRDFDADRLGELLDGDPAQVAISILRWRGGRLYGDQLKDLLCPSVIEPGNWSKWWTKARAALKRSPYVAIEGRSPYLLKHLPQGRSLEQETEAHFAALAEAGPQHAAIEAYLRECASRKKDPDAAFLAALRDQLETRARRQAKSGGKLVLGTRLVERRIEQVLGETAAEQAVVSLLRSADDPIAYIRCLDTAPLWEQACSCLAEALPERAGELFAELLLIAPPGACDGLASRLVALGHSTEQFDELVQRVLADPIRCHQALCWLWDGPQAEQVGGYRLVTVLTRLLLVMREHRGSEALPREQKRQLVTGVRSVLAARKHERFRACLEEIEPAMASALLTQIKRLHSLGPSVREDLAQLLRARFPELETTPTVKPWADDAVLFVTERGLGAKQAEIDQLINVKMRENAKRIGEAAAHGDLSENAEYKFALEERDLLRARLAQMQEQVGIAKVLRPDDIDREHVGAGSKITLRHVETGTTVEMTFLGPWDADLERHIYNYKAPLAQALMGLVVGDTVELTHLEVKGRFEIITIDSALA